MKTDELAALLNRALSVRQRLLSLGDRAATALDTCSLTEEEDMELCSDIETFPELLQHRVNQLIELCTIDPRTFAKPRSGVSSEEQYQSFAQSIVRELRRNTDAAEQVLCKAQAHLPEILSKVHPVSLPLPLFRIWKNWTTETPEGMPTEMPEGYGTDLPDWNEESPKEKKDSVECRLFLSLGGQRRKIPILQVKTETDKVNIVVNATHPYRVLFRMAGSLLGLHRECGECTLKECMKYNAEVVLERIRDGTLRTTKKPDNCQAARAASQRTNELTCYKGSNKYE